MPQESGFIYPMMAKGTKGRVNYVKENLPALVDSSVCQIILTSPGERFWLPSFGCRIRELHFEGADPATLGLAATLVYEAVKQWEPRIYMQSNEDVTCFISPLRPGVLQIEVRYKILSAEVPDVLYSTTVYMDI